MTPIDYLARRTELAKRMRADGEGGVMVLFSAPVQLRNGDVEQDYRQSSDFFYLTGFSEPNCALVFQSDGPFEQGTLSLFVRHRNPEREIWDGPRAGVAGAPTAASLSGADQAFGIDEFEKALGSLLTDTDRLYFAWNQWDAWDRSVKSAISSIKARARTGVWAPRIMIDPAAHLHEMRLLKSEAEVERMRHACSITAKAHQKCMADASDGMAEYELDALLLGTFRAGGSERVAYTSIVGSGSNACILHYRAGARRMATGELVLIDAGCEFEGYASDVTRVFPVSGTFSPEQRAIYELVLKAEEASIAAVKPGATLDHLHNISVRVLVDGLLALGLLQGDADEIVKSESYKRFYMHRTSHWLGMDVHDAGTYFVRGKVRALAPGMVITIEPGLYISPSDETVDAKWRGIGVRIEDDVLVTASGPDVLSSMIPKTILDVEKACKAS